MWKLILFLGEWLELLTINVNSVEVKLLDKGYPTSPKQHAP